MDSVTDFHTLHAMLDWQVELGATEAICDAPINRYDAPEPPAPVATATAAAPAPMVRPQAPKPEDYVARASMAAQGAQTLDELRGAMEAFDGCELKKGARNLVFCDGDPKARVMIIGEPPGRDEDARGKPFVGPAGQLFDRMFAAIGLSRDTEGDSALYVTNILPWHPPGNRDPQPDELAMMLPFVARHIELAAPDILILMGSISCQALLGRKGITRLRGAWAKTQGRPALPMFTPNQLLRNPAAKRDAWHDLLMVQARLRGDA